MRRALAIAVLASLPLIAAQPTGAASRTYVPRDCQHEAYKPRGIVIACGDGNLYMTGMHWSHWRRSTALGSGTAHANDCSPNCAEGRFHRYRARIKLSKPGTCSASGVRQFMRLTISYPGAAPRGPRSYSTPLVCP